MERLLVNRLCSTL